MESHNLLGGIGPNLAILDGNWIFLVQMITKGSPFVSCASQCNHTTSQGENGCNSAIFNRFWIFSVQFNPKGSPFVLCASQGNHTNSHGENGHNSGISWPILDLFGINEHQRISLSFHVVLNVITQPLITCSKKPCRYTSSVEQWLAHSTAVRETQVRFPAEERLYF